MKNVEQNTNKFPMWMYSPLCVVAAAAWCGTTAAWLLLFIAGVLGFDAGVGVSAALYLGVIVLWVSAALRSSFWAEGCIFAVVSGLGMTAALLVVAAFISVIGHLLLAVSPAPCFGGMC